MPAQRIGDAADNRYFRLVMLRRVGGTVLQHINTGLYVGIARKKTETTAIPPHLILTIEKNAEDLDIKDLRNNSV